MMLLSTEALFVSVKLRRAIAVAAVALFALYLIFIYSYVLSPTTQPLPGTPRANLVPLRSINDTLSSPGTLTTKVRILGGNLVLLTPVIITARALRVQLSAFTTLLLLFMISMSIEMYQYIQNSGRLFDVDDLLLNTLGGMIAYFTCYRLWPGPLAKLPSDARLCGG